MRRVGVWPSLVDTRKGHNPDPRRLRALSSRAGVYFVLALGMFPHLGYLRVRGKLTAALAGLDRPRPLEKALHDLRRRIGLTPLKALFEIVAGPLGQPHTPGVRAGPGTDQILRP